MPQAQPLLTRLQNGAIAVALRNQNVYADPDNDHPLPRGLSAGDQITVVGQSAIGAGQRWWRVRKAGEAGFAWTAECDQRQYYLEPAIAPGETVTTYVVKAGDSWSMIAAQFERAVQTLQQADPALVRPHDVIHPGDRMWIPG